MKVRNILSNTAVKVTLVTSCAILLVGLGAFSALAVKATEGKNDNINIEKATNIALQDANFASSDVTKVKGTSENDDGKVKYEIKFNADGKEYEYEISAKTGDIISKSVEKEAVKKPASQTTENKTSTINAEDAKSIALKDANVTNAIFVRAQLDNDDGVAYYDIEFRADGKEYDYDISAKTGAILEKNVEKEEVKKPAASKPAVSEPVANKPATNNTTTITAEAAKSIALKDANVTNATFVKAQLDRDDGVAYYDIEFRSGGKEYDYEISAKTGAILEKSVEKEEVKKPAASKPAVSEPVVEKPATNNTSITVDQAKSIALKDANLTSATFVKAQLDRDDGISYYEIEFRAGGYEYEYEINASNGKIVDKSVERDDD